MDRNTTIAFILIGGILVLWLYLNSPTPPPPQKGKKTDTTQVYKDTTKLTVAPKKTQKTPQKEETPLKTENNEDSLKAARNYGKYFAYSDSSGSIITIECLDNERDHGQYGAQHHRQTFPTFLILLLDMATL